MGYKNTMAVWNVQGLKSNAKLILAFLADRADPTKGNKFWHSIADICKATGIGSPTTVDKHLDTLEARGFITRQHRSKTGPNGGRVNLPNLYTFHYDAVVAAAPNDSDAEVEEEGVPQNLRGGAPETGEGDPRNWIVETVEEQSLNDAGYTWDNFVAEPGPVTPRTWRSETPIEPSRELSAAERADPISPAFHRSEDRKKLVGLVQELAGADHRHDDYYADEPGDAYCSFAVAVMDMFTVPNEYGMTLWGYHHGWDRPPTKASSAYQAGAWLNQFLHAWQKDEGPLEWRGAHMTDQRSHRRAS